jgi:hypothetical protein
MPLRIPCGPFLSRGGKRRCKVRDCGDARECLDGAPTKRGIAREVRASAVGGKEDEI